jgi:hypothetical protein
VQEPATLVCPCPGCLLFIVVCAYVCGVRGVGWVPAGPLDEEMERYDAAMAAHRLRGGGAEGAAPYAKLEAAAAAAHGAKFKIGEKTR